MWVNKICIMYCFPYNVQNIAKYSWDNTAAGDAQTFVASVFASSSLVQQRILCTIEINSVRLYVKCIRYLCLINS